MMILATRLLLLGSLATAVTGCAAKQDPAVPPCPLVALASDASKLTQFRPGSGRDVVDIDYEAQLSNVRGECAYDKKMTRVIVSMSVQIAATRGAAAQSRNADLGYFVAIIGADDEIVARQEFRSKLEFTGTSNRAGANEELEQRIPLSNGKTGQEYRVLIGFLLSHDQLDYNRLLTR
jgi:hypothetical protein